jgi:hypothetical protein
MGMTFDCPHCESLRLKILFVNPADGLGTEKRGPYKGTLSKERVSGTYGTKSGNRFENISIDEKITFENHWSGFIREGNVLDEI